jgi:glyceraldehyde-3-phosphate dehydrogenase/erythrose-4-phosphate dehydrogenase
MDKIGIKGFGSIGSIVMREEIEKGNEVVEINDKLIGME